MLGLGLYLGLKVEVRGLGVGSNIKHQMEEVLGIRGAYKRKLIFLIYTYVWGFYTTLHVHNE